MSKGLDALKRMAEHIRQTDYDKENIKNYAVLQFVDDYQAIEKELEALKIIKEKKVDTLWFTDSMDKSLSDYNSMMLDLMGAKRYHDHELTQYEYDLLKKELE